MSTLRRRRALTWAPPLAYTYMPTKPKPVSNYMCALQGVTYAQLFSVSSGRKTYKNSF